MFTRIRLNALALAASIAAAPATAQPAPDYQYSGATGPFFWQDTAGWEACGRSTEPGARQTPIDIGRVRLDRSLRPLALHILETPINIRNTGHTVEQEYEPGSSILIDGAAFELLQFHFHTVSEHAFKGRRAAAELHAVFRNDATGRLAVVGQLFEFGESNEFLEELFSEGAPLRVGEVIESHAEINVADVFRNTTAYFTYEGSLTTPPCSEVVTWFVLRERASISQEQYDAINRATGNNFRPTQALNGRVVRASAGAARSEE